jgi:aldehyde:ferredoxin oxidoreductase
MKGQEFHGYHSELLRIDLSQRTFKTEPLDPQDLRHFLGGRGLGAALMLREIPAQTDPLGEDNPLIFSTGPLVGTGVAGTRPLPLFNIWRSFWPGDEKDGL